MTHRSLIEQAVFTSARSHGREGYHLVATSPGIVEADARELALWGPTHDSTAAHCPVSGSVNSHWLPSGKCCVSQTTADGSEYSARGSQRIYTQCLVVPPSILVRFANNPFRVIEAASASGRLDVFDVIPPSLDTFRLVGRASSVDPGLLRWIASEYGPRTVAALVQAAMSSPALGIVQASYAEKLLAALLTLFPPPCRRELTLTTGLRFSQRRPFRLIVLEEDKGVVRRFGQRTDAAIFDMTGGRPESIPRFGAWVDFVLEILQHEHWDHLAECYRGIPDDTQIDDLDRVASTLDPAPATSRSIGSRRRASANSRSYEPQRTTQESRPRGNGAASRGRARRSSHASRSTSQGNATRRHAGRRLDSEAAGLTQQLDELYAAVSDAVLGKRDGLARVEQLWADIGSQLSTPLLDESRQRYVLHAMRESRHGKNDPAHETTQAVATMKVLETLFALGQAES